MRRGGVISEISGKFGVMRSFAVTAAGFYEIGGGIDGKSFVLKAVAGHKSIGNGGEHGSGGNADKSAHTHLPAESAAGVAVLY